MENEIWKDVPNYEGYYQVSNLGNVKSLSRIISNGTGKVITKEKYLVPNVLAKGYLQVTFYKNRIRKCYQVHRLVALIFLDNPNNYPQINHINGNKKDNRVENLEWCDNSMNQIHAWKIGLQKPHHCGGGAPKKKVALLDSNGDIERVFDSIREASIFMGCKTPANLSHLLNGKGKLKTIYGRKFKFV